MARSFNMSSFKSQMRQAQRKAERQIKTEVDRVTRKLESEVKQELRKYAGSYEFNKLLQVKKRVEQGVIFLCEISA